MMKVDIALTYEIAKFNGEVTQRRRLCNKGLGAFGEFKLYMPMNEFTCGDMFAEIEKSTPVYFRFSRVTEIKSSADSLRDLRALEIRFFSKGGDYDLICGSSPIFFINEVDKLPKLLSCLKPELTRDLTNYTEFWEFIAYNPETTYMLLWLFSNKGTTKSYRTICYYSINTYLWKNSKDESFFVRYYWKPLCEEKYISRQESEFLAGFDPNVAIRDINDGLSNEENIEFELSVDLIPLNNYEKLEFDPLDTTSEWPRDSVENYKIGKVILNRVATLEEDEKIQVNPRNIVKGIGLSQGKLLNAMCVAVTDAQRQRLGSSFKEPISSEIDLSYDGSIKRANAGDFFSQARYFYSELRDIEKNQIIENILDCIMFLDENLQEKLVDSLTKVDEELGAVVSMGLDL